MKTSSHSLYQSKKSNVKDMTIKKKRTQTLRPAFRCIACFICSFASFMFSVEPTTTFPIRSISCFCEVTFHRKIWLVRNQV